MSRRPRTKWIVNVKTTTGKLEKVIMKFKPIVGTKLADGREVVGVNT